MSSEVFVDQSCNSVDVFLLLEREFMVHGLLAHLVAGVVSRIRCSFLATCLRVMSRTWMPLADVMPGLWKNIGVSSVLFISSRSLAHNL